MRGGVQGRRQTDTSDEISLGTVARAVWRNKRSIIGPTLLDRGRSLRRRQPA